jgi:hypothetical protein
VYGKRLDGFTNDDHPSEHPPGSGELVQAGKPVDKEKNRHRLDLDFIGSQMPPPEAVTGTYKDDAGRTIKVEPLSDEDRRTLVRWIDLGCPIDLDYDPANPGERGFGWMCDDNRPVVTIASPQPGDLRIERVLLGLHDYYSGLDVDSLRVEASFAIDGVAAGQNLADKFKPLRQGVWELKLATPIDAPAAAKFIVSVKDRQGNIARVVRTITRSASQ